MILLEFNNRIVEETLLQKFTSALNGFVVVFTFFNVVHIYEFVVL